MKAFSYFLFIMLGIAIGATSIILSKHYYTATEINAVQMDSYNEGWNSGAEYFDASWIGFILKEGSQGNVFTFSAAVYEAAVGQKRAIEIGMAPYQGGLKFDEESSQKIINALLQQQGNGKN